MQNSTERNTVSLDEEKGGTTFVEHTTMNDQHGVDKKMTIKEYAMSRLPTLKPQRTVPPNPFKLLGLLSRKDWLFFSVATAAWTWDAFDFFTVSLTVTELAASFDRSITDITWGLTLVLMLRSVGAVVFGLASDKYGRKWPFVVNNMMFIVLELGTGFCYTYKQFLACRALFGIAMGGIYGNAVATALEDCPVPARGIISGLLQMGYIVGYMLATVFARALVDTTPHGWRPLFWFGACPPVLIIIFRLFLPETNTYLNREKSRNANKETTKTFVKETKQSIKSHWLLLIYMVLLLAGLNFQTHGTQDLYPTMLRNQLGFSANGVTVTMVVANLGGFFGGITAGWVSDFFGRRLTLIVTFVISAALLYPYTYVSTPAIAAAAFFEQFWIEGAMGIVPIHLLELSPPTLRTFAVGTCYQLGNLASSASSTIEAKLGEGFPLPPLANGVPRYHYGKVICIFTAATLAYNIVVTFVGPERRGISLDPADDPGMHEQKDSERVKDVVRGEHRETGEVKEGRSA